MKKFSKITNQKVNEEPKVDTNSVDESEIIKFKMISLMDKFLSVRTYGPVDKYQRAGLIKVVGQEMLAEAISDMLVDLTNKDKTKLLESLKSEVRDWEAIDNKIDSLVIERASIENRNKIKSLLKMYSDEDLLINVSEDKISRIDNTKTLNDYILIMNENKVLKPNTRIKLIEIYSNRIKQIESL